MANRKNKLKRFSLIAATFGLIIPIIIYIAGYHGPRHFSAGSTLPSAEKVIDNAKKLLGTPYDPLMGMYGNIGASFGFIVCSDIPNIAYGLSGYSWQEVLEKDYKLHLRVYNSSKGNTPGNPYFHRRARNLYTYFKANNRIQPASYLPKPGDLVFYRKATNGYIAHVALVSEVYPGGYNIIESAPKTLIAQEVEYKSPIERGWIFAGFGSVYE